MKISRTIGKTLYSLHQAINETFNGPPPTATHNVDHIDRNPRNNSIENLRWADLSEQQKNQTRRLAINAVLATGKRLESRKQLDAFDPVKRKVYKRSFLLQNGFTAKLLDSQSKGRKTGFIVTRVRRGRYRVDLTKREKQRRAHPIQEGVVYQQCVLTKEYGFKQGNLTTHLRHPEQMGQINGYVFTWVNPPEIIDRNKTPGEVWTLIPRSISAEKKWISNLGRVIYDNGELIHDPIKGPLTKRNRYFVIKLRANGAKMTWYIHRLVYALHYSSVPGKMAIDPTMVIDHGTGGVQDNSITNLNQVTSQRNALLAITDAKRATFGLGPVPNHLRGMNGIRLPQSNEELRREAEQKQRQEIAAQAQPK